MRQIYSLNDYVKTETDTPVKIDFSCNSRHIQSYMHWHPHYEVQMIFSGVYTIENSTTRIDDSRPGIFVHSPYSLHRANADNDLVYRRNIVSISRRAFCAMPSEILDMSGFDGVNFAYTYPDPVQMEEFDRLCHMMDRTLDNGACTSLYATLILRRIIDLIDSGNGEFIRSRVSYMQDVLHFVAENLAEPLTLEALAAQYGVGKSKLNLDFRTATGSTYKKYLTDLRMSLARSLLSDGSGIIDASLETGYSSEAHFIAAYKAYWGITPGAAIRGEY